MFQSNELIGFGASGGIAYTFISSTGGTAATDGNYKVITFTSSGTFTPTLGDHPDFGNKVEYLVVAGGAGGGNNNDSSGGGGAGAYRTATDFTVTATGLTVTIGAGGAAFADGADSVFSSITSDGGGRGVNYEQAGNSGGSGGGGAGGGTAGGATTNSNYGNAGGGGATVGGDGKAGGGGAVGGSSGIGGDGAYNGDPNPTAGDVNTGSGGGGGWGGGAGGSGVVIIRYKFK